MPLPRSNLEQERDGLRRQLAAELSLADDESFLRMIWAVDALQSGRDDAGRQSFRAVPPEAITEDLTNAHAIHPWELETLANELLATPKDEHYRILDCCGWGTVVNVVNLLRNLEDTEYAARREAMPVLREMYRIVGRQFEWQRGFFNYPQFYRNAFVYGQGDCAEYFESTHGITVNQMTLVGFALMVSLHERPLYQRTGNLAMIGVTPESRERALRLISAPLAEARELAASERASGLDTAYRPSTLRRFPCVAFGRRGRRIRAPLPDLIISRVTSGLFYDVVGGGGAIRRDYGARFEEYARRFMRAMLPDVRMLPEWSYPIARQRCDSPDIIGLAQGEDIVFAVECKASRMSFAARFADDAVQEPGYDDMVKAVYQLWRFFSHCRRGLTGRGMTKNAVGIVLTLDSWLVMGTPLREEVMARSMDRARNRDSEILEEDRRPIIFCSMTDLEDTLASATGASFLSAIRRCGTEEKADWLLSSVHQEIREADVERKAFPFDDLERMLPWWGAIGEERRRRAAQSAHGRHD